MNGYSLFKRLLPVALLALCACTPKADEYTLVWADNFDGPVVDTSVWNLEDNARGGGNAEMQYYSPRNVSIERHPLTGDTCLVLTARREDYRNRLATSARLNTQDKVAIQYGKIEARICFPSTANGLWPAFWLLGNDLAPDLGDDDAVDSLAAQLQQAGRVVWPKCGEIDVVEMGHKDGIDASTQDRFFNGACHWGEDCNRNQYQFYAQTCTAPYALQGSFHRFTLLWDKEKIAMYLDRNEQENSAPYFQMDLGKDSLNCPGHYFNKPFYLLFNLSVGGNFPALPAAQKYPEFIPADDPNFQQITALPADGSPVKMYVDYIRVYQKAGSQLIINQQ